MLFSIFVLLDESGSKNNEIMKGFSLAVCVLFSTIQAFSQVMIGGEEDAKPAKKEKILAEKDTVKSLVADGSSAVYFVANWSHTDRVLTVNDGFFGDSLGKRADETSLNLWSYGIGIQNRINKNLMWDGGISLTRNGESYRDAGADSTFAYQTYYSYIGMPLRINYTIGKDVMFYVGTGVMPQIFWLFKQEQKWSNGQGDSGNESIKTKSGYNSFVFSGLFNLGVKLNFSNGWSLLVSPEARIQLNSSYTSQDSYVHKARAYGITFGLTRNL
jgi:hypothetical protein